MIHIRFHGPPCDSYVQTGGNGTSTVKIPTNYEETTGDHGIVKLSTYEVNYEDLFAQELSRNARGIVMVSGILPVYRESVSALKLCSLHTQKTAAKVEEPFSRARTR